MSLTCLYIINYIGWTENDPPDEPQMKQLGVDMATAIAAIHGKKYNPIRAIELYAASGTASDW